MWCFQKGLETGFIKCTPRVYGGDPRCQPFYLQYLIVLPVYTGVIPLIRVFFAQLESTPRVYGGDPVSGPGLRRFHEVLPVYTGVILIVLCVAGNSRCTPRVYGGNPTSCFKDYVDLVYSPRMRECSCFMPKEELNRFIFPTHAMMIQ